MVWLTLGLITLLGLLLVWIAAHHELLAAIEAELLPVRTPHARLVPGSETLGHESLELHASRGGDDGIHVSRERL
jgi:hypothetical protein